MMSFLHGTRYVARVLVSCAALAAVALPAGPHALAQQRGDASTNATTMIQVCEAMGGHATVYSDMSTSHYTVIVECKGGAMDGLNCIFDGAMVDCYQRFVVSVDEIDVVDVSEVAPAPEPTRELPEVVDAPIVEVAPVEQEPSAMPTPDPVVDPVMVDPVVDDGSASPEPAAGPIVDGVKDGLPDIIIDPSLVAPVDEPVELSPIDMVPEIDPVVLT